MKSNPFKSERQRRYLWKFHPDIARRWAEEEKLLRKNPQSEGFEWLDAGSFSDIYRSGWRVEAIVYENNRREIDLSKDIMVSVRSSVSDNAKRFIPNLFRKRVDLNTDGTKEFIYEMPYYEKCEDCSWFDKDDRIWPKDASLKNQIEAISENLTPLDADGISEALAGFRKEAKRLGLTFVNDIRSRNLVRQGKQLILLDTFYAIDSGTSQIEERWGLKPASIFLSAKQLLKSLTQNS